MTRLEKSLRLLRDVNDARLLKLLDEARRSEALLEQHDADARERVSVRQTNIFERIH